MGDLPMGMADRGHRHTCSSCGARFFDLRNDTATCPKCGTVDQTETGRLAAIAALEAEAELASQVVEEDEDERLDLDLDLEDDEDDEGDEEDSLMEDTSDLSHVEDDVNEVLDHMDSPGPVDL